MTWLDLWHPDRLPALAVWMVGTVATCHVVYAIARSEVRARRGEYIAVLRLSRAIDRGRAAYYTALATPSRSHSKGFES